MKYKSMGGLTVKGGRLINDRVDGLSGISQANNLRRSLEKNKRVNEIADGIVLSEVKSKIMSTDY